VVIVLSADVIDLCIVAARFSSELDM